MIGRILRTPPELLAYKAVGRLRRRWRRATVPTSPLRLSDAELRARLRVPYPDDASLLAHFRSRQSPFHLDPRRRAEYVAELDRRWPAERARIVAEADAIAAQPDPDWHLDPHSGTRWPLAHFSEIDYLQLGRPSDVKHIWNLSRQHELFALGLARWLSGDERYAEAALRRVDSWLDANPVEMGVNWTVAMEAAQRLASWSWALHFLVDSPALTPARLRRWLESVWHHGRYIEENLEITTRSGNHLIADAVGLLYAGVAFPEFVDAERWHARGLALLSEQVLAQVYPDGVDYEGSTSYHRMVLEFCLDGVLLARRAGMPVAHAVEERLPAMAALSRAVTGPDGLGPMIGDADDGFLWRFAPRQTDDHRPAIALAAAALGTPRLADEPPPELLWLLGPEGLARYDAAPPDSPGDRVFALGGLYLTRDAADCAALFDCGQLGMGAGGHGGHGHLDCLSLVAWDAAGPLLIDPGTYVYTGDLAARAAFRGTAAHNTLTVDGADQAEMTGPWTLDNRLTPSLHLWHAGERFALVDASHSGFERLPSPVRHRRQLVHIRGRCLLVVDTLFGTGRHVIDRYFHFPSTPGGAASITPTRLQLGERLTLAWPTRPDQTDRLADGWVSRAYGQREPAPLLHQRIEAELPLQLPFVLWPGAPSVALVQDEPRGWRIEHPDGVDRLELGAPTDPTGPLALVLRLADGAELVAQTDALPYGSKEIAVVTGLEG